MDSSLLSPEAWVIDGSAREFIVIGGLVELRKYFTEKAIKRTAINAANEITTANNTVFEANNWDDELVDVVGKYDGSFVEGFEVGTILIDG